MPQELATVDKEHPIVVAVAGGGTGNGNWQWGPGNANYYIGGTGIRSTEPRLVATGYNGQTIGGGLLVVYGEQIIVGAQGKFASAGKPINGSCWAYKSGDTYYSGGAGGGSGGGSINVFYKTNAEGFSGSKFEMTTNGYSPSGTYNVGSIGTEDYIKLLSN